VDLTIAVVLGIDMDQYNDAFADEIAVAGVLVDSIVDDASIVAADNFDCMFPYYNFHTDRIALNFVTYIDFEPAAVADIAVDDDNKPTIDNRHSAVDKLKLIAYYFYQFPRTHKREVQNDTYSMVFVWVVV
jgi:hypothetical protein